MRKRIFESENAEIEHMLLLYNLKIDNICEEQMTTDTNIQTNYDFNNRKHQ